MVASPNGSIWWPCWPLWWVPGPEKFSSWMHESACAMNWVLQEHLMHQYRVKWPAMCLLLSWNIWQGCSADMHSHVGHVDAVTPCRLLLQWPPCSSGAMGRSMCSSLMGEARAHACEAFALAHDMPARASHCTLSFPIRKCMLRCCRASTVHSSIFLLTCRYAYKWKDNGLKLPTLTVVNIHVAKHKSEHTALLGCLKTCDAAGLIGMMHSVPCHVYIRAAQAPNS